MIPTNIYDKIQDFVGFYTVTIIKKNYNYDN